MSSKRRSAEEWRKLIIEWQSTELSAADFARERGLNASTLTWWRWKQGLNRHREPAPLAFIEVVVEEREPPDLFVELGQLRVRVPCGFDGGEVRRLVDALC